MPLTPRPSLMPASLSSRLAALRTISARLTPAAFNSSNGAEPVNGHGPVPASHYFGSNTFGARQMRDKLPKEVYAKLVSEIRLGRKLDLEIAPTVAQVIKEWAVSRGVRLLRSSPSEKTTMPFRPHSGLARSIARTVAS